MPDTLVNATTQRRASLHVRAMSSSREPSRDVRVPSADAGTMTELVLGFG